MWNRYKSQAGAADFREGLFQAEEVLLIFMRAFFKRCFLQGPFELLKDLSDKPIGPAALPLKDRQTQLFSLLFM